jgi:hypothetical protein
MQPVVLVVGSDQAEREEWASLVGLFGFAAQHAENLDMAAAVASVEKVDAILLTVSCGLPACPPSATLRCVSHVMRRLQRHRSTSPQSGTAAAVIFAQPDELATATAKRSSVRDLAVA